MMSVIPTVRISQRLINIDLFFPPSRGDVQSDGGNDELLHAIGSSPTTDGCYGERLQHRPLPAGPHPSSNARWPHEPIWWASTHELCHVCSLKLRHVFGPQGSQNATIPLFFPHEITQTHHFILKFSIQMNSACFKTVLAPYSVPRATRLVYSPGSHRD